MLRLNPAEEMFASYHHHAIDVDDVDDENLLEHFPAAVKFIQSALDAGGSILVHWLVSISLSFFGSLCPGSPFPPGPSLFALPFTCHNRHSAAASYVITCCLDCDLHVAGVYNFQKVLIGHCIGFCFCCILCFRMDTRRRAALCGKVRKLT